MAITEQEILSLAKLARLEFTGEKCASFVAEFNGIVDFANRINEAVEGTTETILEVGGASVEMENLREDEVKPSLSSEKILSNVEAQDGYFPVKRVVK